MESHFKRLENTFISPTALHNDKNIRITNDRCLFSRSSSQNRGFPCEKHMTSKYPRILFICAQRYSLHGGDVPSSWSSSHSTSSFPGSGSSYQYFHPWFPTIVSKRYIASIPWLFFGHNCSTNYMGNGKLTSTTDLYLTVRNMTQQRAFTGGLAVRRVESDREHSLSKSLTVNPRVPNWNCENRNAHKWELSVWTCSFQFMLLCLLRISAFEEGFSNSK